MRRFSQMDEIMQNFDLTITPNDYLKPPATEEDIKKIVEQVGLLQPMLPAVNNSASVRVGELEITDMGDCVLVVDLGVLREDFGIEIYNADSEKKVMEDLIAKVILFGPETEECDNVFEIYSTYIKRRWRFIPIRHTETLEELFDFIRNDVEASLKKEADVRMLSQMAGMDAVSSEVAKKLLYIVKKYCEELSRYST